MNKKLYYEKKAAARDEAIRYQLYASEGAMSWGELAQKQGYFERLARRFGLVAEFRANGLI